MTPQHHRHLATVLAADAASCAVLGIVLAAGAGAIARLTALPESFVLGVGLALIPIAAVIGAAAGSPEIRTRLAPLIVLGNIAWVLASVAILALGVVSPNALGTALVLGQAGAVAILTALEMTTMRPAPAAAVLR